MARILIIAALLMVTTPSAWAQLELDASGNVGIGDAAPSSGYRLRVVGDNIYGVYGRGTRYGLYGSVSSGSSTVYGVNGYANVSSGGGTAYGVRGYARTYDSIAYGVYGYATSYYGGGTWYAGYFGGDLVYTGQMWDASDEKLKKNIRGLGGEGVLEKVRRLRPSSFEHVDNGQGKKLGLGRGRQFGFIAQDVEEVFPELVSEQTHVLPPEPTEEEGVEAASAEPETITFKAVNYMEMIPLLVQALQEQQARIEALEAALERQGIAVPAAGNGQGR